MGLYLNKVSSAYCYMNIPVNDHMVLVIVGGIFSLEKESLVKLLLILTWKNHLPDEHNHCYK